MTGFPSYIKIWDKVEVKPGGAAGTIKPYQYTHRDYGLAWNVRIEGAEGTVSPNGDEVINEWDTAAIVTSPGEFESTWAPFWESLKGEGALTVISKLWRCNGPSPPPSPSPSPTPAPPPGGKWNPPPKKKKMDPCCKATNSMLRKISKVLAVDQLEKGKFKVSEELINPRIDPKDKDKREMLEIRNYAEASVFLMQLVDRHGFDLPIKVYIEDTDKAQAGNQEASFSYNSPSAALQAMLELLYELKNDSANRLNLQVRLAYLTTRLMKTAAYASEGVREIINILGVPVRGKKMKLPLEFNLFAAKPSENKGFKPPEDGKKPASTPATEESLESMLPKLLKESNYNLVVPGKVDPGVDDIRQMLAKILIILSSRGG